ncbi:MAG: hypothetical protein JO362_14105 [Streptomycetaceae bacterium]|nr:hypothetical protein [Streptomycetaceae bacterium]
MRAFAALTTTALAAAAALLLSACGSDVKPSDIIKGAQAAAPPSPSPSVADAARRPKITLPADVHDVFEDTSTGDPVKDAIWHDTAQLVMAHDEAIAEGNPRLPALLYYLAGLLAQPAYSRSVEGYVTDGLTVTGTDRYYAPHITVNSDTASLNYCSDESKAFGKVRKTGKVLTTPVSINSYVLHIAQLKRNPAGVWQTTYADTKRGASQCEQ